METCWVFLSSDTLWRNIFCGRREKKNFEELDFQWKNLFVVVVIVIEFEFFRKMLFTNKLVSLNATKR